MLVQWRVEDWGVLGAGGEMGGDVTNHSSASRPFCLVHFCRTFRSRVEAVVEERCDGSGGLEILRFGD